MNKYFAPLAALALVGLAGCSGNDAVGNAESANAVVETNLTSLDEPLANDAAFGNDAVLADDTAVIDNAASNTAGVDPSLNATGL